MKKLPNIYIIICQELFQPPEVYLFRYEEDAKKFFFGNANLGDKLPDEKMVKYIYHGEENLAMDDFWNSHFKKDDLFQDCSGTYYHFEEQKVYEG